MRRWLCGALAVALLGAAPRALGAQTVTLTVTGAGTPLSDPTLADYVAGYLTDATPISYTLRLNNGRAGCTYTVLVQVRGSATTLGSSKPLSDLLWSTTGSYTAMTATLVTVATHTLTSTSANASGNITLRVVLNWTDTAASYAGTGLVFATSASSTGAGC